MSATVDTNLLNRLWDQLWPQCRKVPYELRDARDRWVRFHCLPNSKRYPEDATEYGIVLERHNTVLAKLINTETIIVATPAYSDQPVPSPSDRSSEAVAVQPTATYWASTCTDSEPGYESWIHLYVEQLQWTAGCLDPLLRLVADDVIADVLIMDPGLKWLHHPYDGGMDILMHSSDARDDLRLRHQTWLSLHPSGL